MAKGVGMWNTVAACLATALLAGCSGATSGLSGANDASASTSDGAPSDATPADGSVFDGPMTDHAAPDTGSPSPDGAADGGSPLDATTDVATGDGTPRF